LVNGAVAARAGEAEVLLALPRDTGRLHEEGFEQGFYVS